MSKVYTIFVICLFCSISSAQVKNEEPTEKDFYMEGSLRLSFGKQTRIGISPAINYQLTPKLLLGTGIIAEYYSSTTSENSTFSTGIYGVNLIADYKISRLGQILNPRTTLSLHAEQEFLNYETQYFDDEIDNGRSWTNVSLLGLKVKRKIGTKNRFALSLIAVWNLNNNSVANSLYNNPVIKLGFQF